MRKFVLILLITTLFSALAQGQGTNISMSGQWGKGKSEAVFRRGGYTLVGNGGYLELYRSQLGSYEKLDVLRMPGPVKDIWVKGDTTNVYVACGDEGLRVVYLDYKRQFAQTVGFYGIIGIEQTGGYANGVVEYKNYTYLADGFNGLVAVYTGIPSDPQYRSNLPLSGFARDAWALNDTTVLVAADTAGLFSINVSNPYNLTIMDELDFDPAFPVGYPNRTPIVYNVLVVDTVAYVALGGGGMQIVDVRDPGDLKLLGRWIDSRTPIDVRDVWVNGNNYAYLACGEDGIYGQINVQNPNQPGIAPYSLNTAGMTSAIVVEQDTAFVGDGYNGHLVVDARVGVEFSIMDSEEMSDITRDVAVSNGYAYMATGNTGIKVMSTNVVGGPDYYLEELETFDTGGEARRVVKRGSWVYVADGSLGLTILDALNPSALVAYDVFDIGRDTCYDVDVSPTYAFLACGNDGMRVVNIAGTVFEAFGSPFGTQNLGQSRAVRVDEANNRVFLGTTTGIYAYNISAFPITELSRLEVGNFDPRDIDVDGNTVFVANGDHGFLIWDWFTGSVNSVAREDVCTDIAVKENTVLITEIQSGLRLFDFSKGFFTLDYREVGNYDTGGRPQGLALADDDIYVADGEDGLYVLESQIKPKIVLDPDALHFGPVPRGQSRPLVVWVKNEGLRSLEVNNISVPQSMVGEFEFSSTSFTVIPDSAYKLVVTYSPTAPLPIGYEDWTTASVFSNDTENSPDTLELHWRIGAPLTKEPYIADDFTVGLWHLDELMGSTAVDASLPQYNGTLIGNPIRQASRTGFGQAVLFDGIDDRIVASAVPQFNFPEKQFTAELWFNMTSRPDSYYILLKKGIGSRHQYEMALANTDSVEGLMGQVQDIDGKFYRISTGSIDSLSPGQWYHAALTWDRATLRLYLNGVLKAERLFVGPLYTDNQEQLAFGAYAAGNAPFQGMIDEVRVSNVARQSWEFHVHHSHLVVGRTPVNFGSVFLNYSRRLPLTISNGGSEVLDVTSISTLTEEVSVTNTIGFDIEVGGSRTIWLTYTPESAGALTDTLIITSSDPTFPNYKVPLIGEGTSQAGAGPYDSDPFTIGLWHFDELAGNPMIYDASDNGMHGSWTGYDRPNGKFNPPNIFDRSLLFRSETSTIGTIEPGEQHYIGPDYGGFSVEGWIYIESFPTNKGNIVKRQSNPSQFTLSLNSDSTVSGVMYNDQANPISVSTQNSVKLDNHLWYHVAMALSDNYLRLFINGDLVDSTAFTGTLAGTVKGSDVDTLSVLIGRDWQGNEPFDGRIDEVRISSIGRQRWELNAIQARIEVSSDNLNFSRVLRGSQRTMRLRIENPGYDSLTVEDIHTEKPLLFSVDEDDFSIAPDKRRNIYVTFIPSDTLTQLDTLFMTTNDPFYPLRRIPLSGKGMNTSHIGPYRTDALTLALYHFDAVSDTSDTLYDSSGNGLNGVVKGNAEWAGNDSSWDGGSLMFDGVDDWVEITENTNIIDFTDTDFTVELWFSMLTKPANDAVLLKRGSTRQQIELLLHSTDGIRASVWDTLGVARTLTTGSMNALNIGQWYHVAFSWDGDSLHLTLDNTVLDTDTLRRSLRSPSMESLTLGRALGGGQLFHGFMDELRISTVRRLDWEVSVRPPRITVSPSSIDFAGVLMDYTRTIPLIVSNGGDQSLTVRIVIAGDVFSVPTADTLFGVPRLSQHNVPVTFTPTTPTGYEGSLILTSNDVFQPTTVITLQGSGAEWKGKEPYQTDSHTDMLFHFNTNELTDTSAMAINGPNAVLNGVRGTENGFFSGGLTFDGVNDYALIPFHQDIVLDLSTEDFTIECFFRTDTVSQILIFRGYEDFNHSINYGFFIDNEGRLIVDGYDEVGPRVNDYSWHHLAFTFNHTTQIGQLYIDGVLIWTAQHDGTPYDAGDRPLVIGAAEYTEGQIYRNFEGYLDEFRISDIVREPWEFQLPAYGIEANSLTPNPPVLNQALSMNIHVPTGHEATGVRILYRDGGSSSEYQAVSTLAVDATTFSADIPADGITLNGLEYYVEVETAEDTLLYPGLDPRNKPMAVGVRHPELETPMTFYSYEYYSYEKDNTYHQVAAMFTVPSNLDLINMDAILLDDFGIYNPYEWQIFWWHPDSSQQELERKIILEQQFNQAETEAEREQIRQELKQIRIYFDYPRMIRDEERRRVIPGRAYWMVGRLEREFDIGGGQTVPTDSSYEIALRPGWSMIGSPFHFPVRWDDCFLTSDLVNSITAWNGQYEYDRPILEPWKGYWIHNPDSVIHKLFIPPRSTTALAKASLFTNGIAYNLQEEEWLLSMSVETDGVGDSYNYIGVRDEADNGRDRFDRVEAPPSFGNYVSLYFNHTDWESYSDIYTADIRGPEEEGHVWEFTVETNVRKKPVKIRWTKYHDLPEGWQVFLFDPVEGTAKDMIKQHTISYTSGKDYPSFRRFRIVSGTQAFIEKHCLGIPLQPVEFHLFQNYPNPFNPETTIQYSIPKNGHVEIMIYNAIGQHVRTLVRESMRTGHHQVVWDGRDDYGRGVASGVYICRLKLLDKVATRKMIILR